MDDFHEEDRKAMGTRYNTKFYISPNVSRNHQKVIKVVDNEDDEEDEDEGGVTLVTRPVGMAAYVLAAFGIVPLLLAVVFATKFLMQRRQRRVSFTFIFNYVVSRAFVKKKKKSTASNACIRAQPFVHSGMSKTI